MLHINTQDALLKLLCAFVFLTSLACLLVATEVSASAQTRKTTGMTAAASKPKAEDEPIFNAYKGVKIGMNADEARKVLGDPNNKGDEQDLYLFGEKEIVQVYYDGSKKVSAISVDFMGAKSGAPEAKTVFGTEIEAKADGSMYKLIRYPKAGYWVSYCRTAGDAPTTTVTMQKMQ
jgi:hypothetical protein